MRSSAWWIAGAIVALVVAAAAVAATALGRDGTTVATPPELPVTTTASAEPTSTSTSIPATPATTPSAETPSSTAEAEPTTTPPSEPGTTTPSLAPVDVVIATSGWRNGAAVVSGYATVIEDGGTCTATLTRGDVQASASRPATPDAQTTSCGLIEVQDPALTPGTWTVVLAYTSRTSTGTSEPMSITIG